MNKNFVHYNRPPQYDVVNSNKFVDVNGRLVTVVLDEYSPEIYVSLTELKKSGFELFEAGSLPKPGGYLNCLTELQINHFDLYMRMKAAKYLSRSVMTISKDRIDDCINHEKEFYKLGANPDRKVSYSNKGNFSITAKVNPSVDLSSTNIEHNAAKTNYNGENNLEHSPTKTNYTRENNLERNATKTNYNRENNLERNATKTNYNRDNSKPHQRQNQRINNYRSPNVERNNTNSYRKNSHETAVSPSNSHGSFTKKEENRNIHSRKSYSDKIQPTSPNSSYSTKPEQTPDVTQTKPPSPVPLLSKPLPEIKQNNIHQRKVSSSDVDVGSNSSMVSSTPIQSHESKPSEQAKTCNRKCAIDTVCQGGMFEYVSTIDDTTIVAFTVPLCYTSELALLSDIAEESHIKPSFAPALGDLIAVFSEGEETYVRGIVRNIVNNNYTCNLIDFGTIVTTTNIRPLPEKFSKIPEFVCCVTGSVEDIKEIKTNGNTINLDITSPGKLTLEIEGTCKKYEVQAKLWDFLSNNEVKNSAPLQIFKVAEAKNELKSGDQVKIVSQVDGSLILRTRECVRLLKEVDQAIETHQAEALLETPIVKQLVLCPYSTDEVDGLYRAEVLSVDGKFAKVKYVDFGDRNQVPISTFKAANKTLANITNTYIAISLHEFCDKKFTVKQLTYLGECCDRGDKFTLVSKGAAHVFDLLSTDGISLSKKLIDLEFVPPVVKPSPPPVVKPVEESVQVAGISKPSLVKKIYFPSLPECHLDIGLNSVLCTSTDDVSDGAVTFCPITTEVTDRLLEISKIIGEHLVEDNEPYKAEELELCIALYEDDWYRGSVMKEEEGGFIIFFVDYGNASFVKYEDVRKITDKLASYAACAAVCILEDVKKDELTEIQEPLLSKLLENISENTEYEINVIKKSEEFYNITIPSIYDKLKKEGVL